jgi:hypothetical protein
MDLVEGRRTRHRQWALLAFRREDTKALVARDGLARVCTLAARGMSR